MKKRAPVFIMLLLCVCLIFPMTALAKTYTISDTDIHVDIDDSRWYVFTRDNIQNNPELEELGLSVEYMEGVFRKEKAYMDAVLIYEDGSALELFIRKSDVAAKIVNLSNYDDDKVLELAKELAKKQSAEDYSVYETQYKFAKLEYFDANYNYYLCEFFTIVNKESYTLTFQSPTPYGETEYAEIEAIINSVRFDVDTSLKEDTGNTVLASTIRGAVIGGVCGGAVALVGVLAKKKKAKKASSESNPETTDSL